MYQEYLVKIIGKLIFITVKLCGIWPYSFDSSSQTFSLNSFFLIYSFIFSSATLILFYIYNTEIFDGQNQEFSSFAIKIISFLYYNVMIILYITLYLGNYCKFNQIKKLLINGCKFCTSSEDSYVGFLIMFLVKSVVYDFLFIYITIADSFQNSKSPYATVFGAIYITIPPVVIRVVPNLHYGCILGGHFYFRKINSRIKILCKTIRNDLENEPEHIYDQLERIYLDHLNLTKLINRCNDICSLQIVLYVFSQIIGLLFFTIAQFILFKHYFEVYATFVRSLVFSTISIVLIIYDLYATFAACDRIVTEVNITLILHRFMLRYS